MAKVPSLEESERAILDGIKDYNIRPNGIVPIGGLSMKVMGRGFTAAEFNAALDSMQKKGWIELKAGIPFITVTSAGYAEI